MSDYDLEAVKAELASIEAVPYDLLTDTEIQEMKKNLAATIAELEAERKKTRGWLWEDVHDNGELEEAIAWVVEAIVTYEGPHSDQITSSWPIVRNHARQNAVRLTARRAE